MHCNRGRNSGNLSSISFVSACVICASFHAFHLLHFFLPVLPFSFLAVLPCSPSFFVARVSVIWNADLWKRKNKRKKKKRKKKKKTRSNSRIHIHLEGINLWKIPPSSKSNGRDRICSYLVSLLCFFSLCSHLCPALPR